MTQLHLEDANIIGCHNGNKTEVQRIGGGKLWEMLDFINKISTDFDRKPVL